MASSNRGLRAIKAMKDLSISSLKSDKDITFDITSVYSKVKIISASEKLVRGTFIVEPTMCNMLNFIHGGYIASIIDGISCFSYMCHPNGKMVMTTNLNVIYCNPAWVGQEVSVESKAVFVGGNTVMNTIINNETTKKIIAIGTACIVPGNQKLQDAVQDIIKFDFSDNN